MKLMAYPTGEAEDRIKRGVNRSLSYPMLVEHTVLEIIKAMKVEEDLALLLRNRAQRRYSCFMPCEDGYILKLMLTQLAGVSLGMLGGRAGGLSLIPSLLMNSITAITAGVPSLQVYTPTR